jgi:acyl-CoA reductase-like NAD-dependent aldehyde dehydrogenase
MNASSVVTFDEFFIGGNWAAPSTQAHGGHLAALGGGRLAGSIWTSDIDHAITRSSRVETGTIAINGFGCQMVSPFGGVKSSGLGREMGPEGLNAYIELQSVLLPPAQ